MTTRSASIPQGVAVDITAALALETGRGYLLAMGPSAKSDDSVIIALDGDPQVVGGHFLDAGGPGRFIKQTSATWFARFHDLQNRSSQLTVTEADDCA